ncbi:MAG: metallophosphoesterase family protein [Dehalococcoidales bacterium]|jgi:predicted phosphodiesterase
MRIAILADIHANLAALKAVLNDIKEKGEIDAIWCLGDIVGYGPDPGECIGLLRELNPVCVAGNHDLGAIGKLDLAYFNPAAAEACLWTAQKLNPVDARFLEDLPKTAQQGDFLLVHGSPTDPIQEYILSTSMAEKNFGYFECRYCLVGHTHAPLAFKKEENGCVSIPLSETIGLVMKGHRLIINPGAVGQPRDGDPRASYGIYDSEGSMFRLHRVEYNVRATQDKMMQAGLPVSLVTRLEVGK